MKKLLNTLFVTTENAYLSLDGENVVVNIDKTVAGRFPLHNLCGIICFSYSGASPALIGACAERNIQMTFCTPRGRFLARTAGITNGNVLLRRQQYRYADDLEKCCIIARNMIFGKLYNCRWSVERTRRDHTLRIDEAKFLNVSATLKENMETVLQVTNMETLRGLEGSAATAYFSVYDDMILRNKQDFFFHTRNRRPPLDNVNAMLSFTYSLLSAECASALESVGLDSYVGFMHSDRPGRASLALDLIEELRPCIADRFVLTLVNNQILKPDDFLVSESEAVRFTEDGRKKLLRKWQEHKQEMITHPYLKEKIAWGLVPYVQAILLARYIRGDIDSYPPFLWK